MQDERGATAVEYAIISSLIAAVVVVVVAALGTGVQHLFQDVLDAIDIVVHVFTPEAREFYRLDRLWREAPQLAFDASTPA